MSAIQSLVRGVRETVDRYSMVSRGDRVVVAVSGGADSLCLLDVLCRLAPQWELRLVVAHYDHGLREGEDEIETRLVRDQALERGLPFEVERAVDLLEAGGGLEERAREARYAFLERVRRLHRAGCVAMGHTLDDQAETVLMRLLRGAGPDGLAAIPPVREPGVIRPLIQVRRREVEAYLREAGLGWRTDSSNLSAGPLRNRIRLELLPQLLRCQPLLVEHLGEMADLLREEGACLDRIVQDWIDAESTRDGARGIALPRTGLLALDPALQRRAVRLAVREAAGGLRRIHRVHVRAVMDLARGERPQAGIDLPGGLRVRRSYERLVFGPAPRWEAGVCETLPSPGTYTLPRTGFQVVLEEKPRDEIHSLKRDRRTALLDAEGLRFPLTLRSIRPGDRFVPLGMQGSRKVKDVLIDGKVPSEERARGLLLVSGDEPLWLCGYRIDDRHKVTAGTRLVLEVRVEPLLQ